MSTIQVVGAQAYLAGLNAVHESDECLTHLAQVHHPAYGARIYYLKHYLEDRGPTKGLVNEAIGFTLAAGAGLFVPGNPLIITVPAQRVAEMHRAFARRLARNTDVLLWGTERVAGHELPQSLEQATDILRRWKGLPHLIAFDTWVQIPDRSATNLLRQPGERIVLIDHGHLAGSVNWTADLLQPDTDPRHPFLGLWGGGIPDAINQGIMHAAQRHAERFREAESELKHWTNALLDDSRDRIAILDFLEKRAAGSEDRMRKILGLLV